MFMRTWVSCESLGLITARLLMTARYRCDVRGGRRRLLAIQCEEIDLTVSVLVAYAAPSLRMQALLRRRLK